MDALLWPGMTLMRRMRVTAKFATVLLLLLVPLTISLLLGGIRTTRQIDEADRERHGLTYVEPLVRLVAQIAEVRQEAAAGRLVDRAALPAVHDVDEVDARYGDDFGVHPQWLRLRDRVRELTGGLLSSAEAGRSAARRSRRRSSWSGRSPTRAGSSWTPRSTATTSSWRSPTGSPGCCWPRPPHRNGTRWPVTR